MWHTSCCHRAQLQPFHSRECQSQLPVFSLPFFSVRFSRKEPEEQQEAQIQGHPSSILPVLQGNAAVMGWESHQCYTQGIAAWSIQLRDKTETAGQVGWARASAGVTWFGEQEFRNLSLPRMRSVRQPRGSLLPDSPPAPVQPQTTLPGL